MAARRIGGAINYIMANWLFYVFVFLTATRLFVRISSKSATKFWPHSAALLHSATLRFIRMPMPPDITVKTAPFDRSTSRKQATLYLNSNGQ